VVLLANSKKPPTLRLKVRDLDCLDCARALERVVRSIEGVQTASVSFTLSTIEIVLRDERDRKAVIRRLRRKGYDVYPAGDGFPVHLGPLRGSVSRRRLYLTAISGVCLAAGLVAYASRLSPGLVRYLLVGATAAGLSLTVIRALSALRSWSIDMDVLMSVAIIAAAGIGEWEEAAVVAFLFSVAVVLEALAMARTRKAIESLMELSPDIALVRRDGGEAAVDAAIVTPGESIIVKPGERIPLEGEILSGITSVDESAITGESMPATKGPGAQVFAGTLNEDGLIEVKVTKPKAESTLARIIHLIEHVEESKAPVERFVDRFARIYTPTVVVAALAIGIVPYLAGMEKYWVYRSIVVLIIACPCALVIATPVAIVSGLTAAARKGILIKGGAFLELAANTKAIALDKTGTMTLGRPAVSEVRTLGRLSEDDLVRLASAIESGSTHPLAGAVMAEARRRQLHWKTPESVTAIPGSGITGKLDGRRYTVAKPEYLTHLLGKGRLPSGLLTGKTSLAVGSDTEILGLIEFTDAVRPGASDTLAALKRMGMERAIMITGDRRETAEDVGTETGVDAYFADLLPDRKVDVIRQLKREFDTVAMVGDGINDAPALAAADVGVAMGAAGSDAAIDAAGVALMSDDIGKLVPLFGISKSVKRIIMENISLAIGIKGVFLALAAVGRATMWMAVFADMGASLIVIANALRLLKDRWREQSKGWERAAS
jgi:Cd2+/Zn2+-exporting ATPase